MITTNNQVTRSQWLELAYQLIRRDLLPEAPHKCNVTLGFPGIGSKNKTIGSSWNGFSDGGFISIHPKLGNDKNRILDVLAHEMIHVIHPLDGHRKRFRELAVRIGLEGKMTATVAGEAFKQWIDKIMPELPPWPDGSGELKSISGPKKQGTRLIKLECACGRIIRATQKTIDEGEIACMKCNDVFKRA